VALLRELGAQGLFHTAVLSPGHLGGAGVWHGNLYLHGDGDPTFGDGTFIRIWDQGSGANAQALVPQLAAIGRGELGPRARGVEAMRVTLHESHVASAAFDARLK